MIVGAGLRPAHFALTRILYPKYAMGMIWHDYPFVQVYVESIRNYV
jgi:hypothetical protein